MHGSGIWHNAGSRYFYSIVLQILIPIIGRQIKDNFKKVADKIEGTIMIAPESCTLYYVLAFFIIYLFF